MAKAKRKGGTPSADSNNKAGKSVNKMAAVKQALDELGSDAKPLAILDHIRKLGVDMSTAMVSNYKSLLLHKAARQSRPARQPRARAVATGGRGERITLDDVQAVKKLADRIGAENVRKLAEVLSS